MKTFENLPCREAARPSKGGARARNNARRHSRRLLVFPPASTPRLSSYLTSKMAMLKTLEFLATENPSVSVASAHPGMVDTGFFRSLGEACDVSYDYW